LTVDQLCQLPVAEQVARNAVPFLCVPGPLLVIGAHPRLIKAWGFRPTAMGFMLIKLRPLEDPTNFTLADLHTGAAFATRKNAEYVVLCKRGKSLRREAGVHEIIVTPRPSTAANRMCYITASSDMSAARDRFSNCLQGNPDLAG
jgi:hypothetical protein